MNSSLPGLALFVAATTVGFSAEKTSESAPPSKYPRTNLAPEFEVVPGWPQRPAEAKPAAVASIALDAEGKVWVYTRTNPVVQIYTPDGRFLRGWHEENLKTVPHGIAFDRDGNVWLVDTGLHVARKFSPDGQLLLTLGTLGVAGLDDSHFDSPTDITFTPNGDIFVADGYGNSRVVRFDRTGRFLKAWGSLGTEPGQFSIPHAIKSDSKGRLYVADRNNVRIQVFDAEGQILDTWKNIVVPWGFWISPNDEIWVCGSSPMQWTHDPKYPTAPLGCPPKDQILVKFDPTGRVLELHTLPKGEDGHEKPGDLNWLHTIALDTAGNIYAGDIIGKRVQKFVRK